MISRTIHPALGRCSLLHLFKTNGLYLENECLKIGGAVTLVLVGLFTLPIPFGSLKVTGSDKVTVQDVMVAGDIHEPVIYCRLVQKIKN